MAQEKELTEADAAGIKVGDKVVLKGREGFMGQSSLVDQMARSHKLERIMDKVEDGKLWKAGWAKEAAEDVAAMMGYVGNAARGQRAKMDKVSVSAQSFGVDANESIAIRRFQEARNASSYKKGLVGALVIGSVIAPEIGALMVAGHVLTGGYAGRVATKALLGIMSWVLGLGERALSALAGGSKAAHAEKEPAVEEPKGSSGPKDEVDGRVATVEKTEALRKSVGAPTGKVGGQADGAYAGQSDFGKELSVGRGHSLGGKVEFVSSGREEALPPSMDDLRAELASPLHQAGEVPLPPTLDELTGLSGKLKKSRSQMERERVAEMERKQGHRKTMSKGMDM